MRFIEKFYRKNIDGQHLKWKILNLSMLPLSKSSSHVATGSISIEDCNFSSGLRGHVSPHLARRSDMRPRWSEMSRTCGCSPQFLYKGIVQCVDIYSEGGSKYGLLCITIYTFKMGCTHCTPVTILISSFPQNFEILDVLNQMPSLFKSEISVGIFALNKNTQFLGVEPPDPSF